MINFYQKTWMKILKQLIKFNDWVLERFARLITMVSSRITNPRIRQILEVISACRPCALLALVLSLGGLGSTLGDTAENIAGAISLLSISLYIVKIITEDL